MTKTKQLIICALFAALIAIVAPFAIVIGPVPVTFTLFALALTAFVCGSHMAAEATLIYILTGIIGMPVFGGFKGGIAAFSQPTGGFIFAYIFIVLILGQCVKTKNKPMIVLLWILALGVCYFFGTVWYMLVTKASLFTALSFCIIPFIPFDIVKIVMAYIVGKVVRKTLKREKLV